MDGAPSRTLADAWPLFGLRITTGPLELRPVTDPDIPVLADLAGAGHPRSGVHAVPVPVDRRGSGRGWRPTWPPTTGAPAPS